MRVRWRRAARRMIVLRRTQARGLRSGARRMASADANGRKRRQHGPGTIPAADSRYSGLLHAIPEHGVSWVCLHGLSIGIEFADQSVSIFLRSLGEVGDEGFDQLTTGVLECLRAAEVSGIGLHQSGIEVVLADQKTELIPQTRLMTLG